MGNQTSTIKLASPHNNEHKASEFLRNVINGMPAADLRFTVYESDSKNKTCCPVERLNQDGRQEWLNRFDSTLGTGSVNVWSIHEKGRPIGYTFINYNNTESSCDKGQLRIPTHVAPNLERDFKALCKQSLDPPPYTGDGGHD
jgi:hypothetical protein